MLHRFAKWFINIPIVWNTFQNVVGANSWKNRIYPSVFKSKGAMLDFGCSMGNNTEAFLQFKYHGVDIDRAAIEAAKKRWAGTPDVSFESLDILKHPYMHNYFDNVLFAGTGHHLTDEEIPHILDALLLTLHPGGELHFFDVLRQPGKDRFITRIIMNNDQGKNMRTREMYRAMFAPYNVVEEKVFESPDRFIKLQDMLYFRVGKN
ncbi:MAG: class I SAM-dependent methyltransferase [bacterium]|nr:class I SAM-dependent methyltransferase [bacterium]